MMLETYTDEDYQKDFQALLKEHPEIDPETNAIVLSGIDEYIKQNNQFVIDNEKALRDFYNNSKMDFLICFGVNNRCQVYQDTPPGKVVSLKLCGSIDKDNNFTWNVINTSSKDYLSLNIYNFLYNSELAPIIIFNNTSIAICFFTFSFCSAVTAK